MDKRKIFIGFVIIILTFNSCNKIDDLENDFNTKKLEIISKIWGFLKYHHPYVGQGKVDWDDFLIDLIKKSDTINCKSSLNKLIEQTINNLPFEASEDYLSKQLKSSLFLKRQINWLNDSTIISQKNINKLNYILNNKGSFENYYLSQDSEVGNLFFDNEKAYIDSLLPSRNLRLLSLFRYWNIIYYYYPYLEINDLDWEQCLVDFIPKFINADDTLKYHLIIQEFTAKLNDGHIWTESIVLSKFWGYYSPYFKLRIVENKPIVFDFFSDSLAAISLIKTGDQLISINNQQVDKLILERKKYYPNSNHHHQLRRIVEEMLITNKPDSMTLAMLRRNDTIRLSIKPYFLFELYQIEEDERNNEIAYRTISDSIGYINLGLLNKDSISIFMDEFMNFDKIIIDIRNYPNNVLYELSKFFNPEPKIFANVFIPNKYVPGEFLTGEPLKVGVLNHNYYKGQIVLLVNEQTQSHAEFTVMCLQTAPNVITIGSQTAGTDGNISYINLPGGINTYFTGIGIIYPDQSYTQRVGIKIDSIIEPKIIDYEYNFDRVLNTAIHL